MNTIERLRALGYTIEERGEIRQVKGRPIFNLFTPRAGNSGFVSPHAVPPYYFLGDIRRPATIDEADRLAEAGTILKCQGIDVYRDYYNMDEDDVSYLIKGHGLRTGAYLDAVAKGIGLLRDVESEDGYNPDGSPMEQWNIITRIQHVGGGTEIGKLPNGEYIAATEYRADIDAYVVIKAYFDHLPAKEDIVTYFHLRELRMGFERGRYHDVYTCWECGQTVHWLDGPKVALADRIARLEERYCGC